MSSPAYLAAAEELRPNDDQWQAYESQANCVVLAGPGSGKTKVITTKIARLLTEDLRAPRRLACITYSNACVGELRARLRKLGVADDGRLVLSTVHSFCLTELVLPYARIAGLSVPDPLVVAPPSQSRALFEKAYKQIHHNNPPRWFRVEFDRVRRTVLDRSGKQWKEWPGTETQIVEVYENLLLSEGVVDFDGLVLTGLQLIENFDWVRRCVRAKYPIIVIDEYQDLGLPLHRMVVYLMKKAGVRIIAVGDPDQSIYGFTGAQPILLRKLAASSDVESVELKLNYRCADQIIAASKTLLANPSEFKSHDGRKGEILIDHVEDGVRGQADLALGTIIPELFNANPEWKPGDVAILYRSLNEGALVAEAADALNMRYFRLDNGSPIKRSRITDWLTDAARWCAGSWRTGEITLGQLLKTWRLMRLSVTIEKDLLAERARLISMLFTHRQPSTSLHKWLLAMEKAVLKITLEEEAGLADEKDNFADLLHSSKDGPLREYTVETFGSQGRSPDQINLMTLHSSKGLEFQAVIMVGLEAGEFPSRFDNTAAKLDEARRLFYVGLTRAKEIVHLMYGFDESQFITQVREAAAK